MRALRTPPRPFDTSRVEPELAAGWQLYYQPTVGSTQDVARDLARAGAPDRTLVLADYQARGRGRQGRRWLAEPGTALTFSVLFRATSTPNPHRYTMLASVAVCDALRRLAPSLAPSIKWPNDVLLDERKVAGVLAEAEWFGDELRLIVGIGINVGSDRAQLAASGPSAISLRLAGASIGREALLLAIVERLDWWSAQPLEALRTAWQAQLWGVGQRLRVAESGQEQDVVVLGVAEDGRLRVRAADGREWATLSGELLL